MRALLRIGTILLCLVLFAGCIAAPSPTAAPTAVPSSSATATPAPTDSPAPTKAPTATPTPGPTPVPDHETFTVRIGTLSLEPGTPMRIPDLVAVLGMPAVDRTFDRSRLVRTSATSQSTVHALGRRLVFGGLRLTLHQELDSADKDTWDLDVLELPSATYATMRGLRVGSSVAAARALFDPAAYRVQENGLQTDAESVVDELEISRIDEPEGLWGPRTIFVEFLAGKVSGVRIQGTRFIP
jgi:hypothetical protein